MAFLGGRVPLPRGLRRRRRPALLAVGQHERRPGRSPWIAVSFVVGASASGLAGYFGMRVATNANVRTTAGGARRACPQALAVAFSGGAVMGMSVVGLALLGLGGLYILYTRSLFARAPIVARAWLADPHGDHTCITGFSMGASSIALFARVGGGIYTKAADVGADLVGKVEAGLPEDDPRNPAVIADNVGDNVGDVAGMGADLFESYVGAIVGAMVLGLGFSAVVRQPARSAPSSCRSSSRPSGIICSIVGTFFVRTKEGGNPQLALDTGAFGAAGVMAVGHLRPRLRHVAGDRVARPSASSGRSRSTGSTSASPRSSASATGVAVGLITSLLLLDGQGPGQQHRRAVQDGHATNIIAGLGLGMQSTALPILCIAVGVDRRRPTSPASTASPSPRSACSRTTGIQLAVDAYGPIADNAGGIAEMSHQEPEVRERTDKLDAVGNTTAAIGKGFAIGSAAMTALALFAAFAQQSRHRTASTSASPMVMAGIFIGGMLPFLFSSMAMKAVGEAAMDMIEEVRRQFREIHGPARRHAPSPTPRAASTSPPRRPSSA